MYHYNYSSSSSQPNEVQPTSTHYNVRVEETKSQTWEPPTPAQLENNNHAPNGVWSPPHKFPAESSQRSALANYIKPQDVPERNFTSPQYQVSQPNGNRVFPNNSLIPGGGHVMHHNGNDGPNRVPPTVYFPRRLLNSSESQIKTELENSQQLPAPNLYHHPLLHNPSSFQMNVNSHLLNDHQIDLEQGNNGLTVQSDPSSNFVGNESVDDKKDDKWGSLIKAGKKYSNIKSIFVKKSTPPTPEPRPKADQNGFIPKQENSSVSVGGLKVSNSSSIDAQLNRDAAATVVCSQANGRGGPQYSSLKSWNESSLSRKQRCNSLQQVNESVQNSNRFPLYEQSLIRENQNRVSATLGHIEQSKVNEMFQQMERHNSCEAFTNRFARLSKSNGNLETQAESKDSRLDIESPCNNNPNNSFSSRPVPQFEGRTTFQGANLYHNHQHGAHDASQDAERLHQSSQFHINSHHLSTTGDDSEWIDITDVETTPCVYNGRSNRSNNFNKENKNQSRDCGTPPLPPLFPEGSPNPGLRKHSHSFSASSAPNRPDLLETSSHLQQQQNSSNKRQHKRDGMAPGSFYDVNESGSLSPHVSTRWNLNAGGKPDKIGKSQGEFDPSQRLPSLPPKASPSIRCHEPEDEASTDAAIDLTSINEGATEATSDDDDMSSVDDRNSYLLRKQLQGLEGMYSEVLKLLGNRSVARNPEARMLRRRLHGSMSSLQSSVVSGRPFVPIRRIDARSGRMNNDRDKRGNKESTKMVDKRFQRLESHVVTLARSVAHLSSEMRTQHLMFQEIESLREELSSLRVGMSGGGKSKSGVQTANRGGSGLFGGDFLHSQNGIPNPLRVKKLTHFFGDEPPLVRFFLRGLGYEKYASIFENEKIGMLELPYMTEERLLKIGIPLGPRLRILQEAQGPIKTEGNLSVYVV